MHNLSPLIFDLTIMLGIASLVTLIFQRIQQPVVLGYLVAGIIIGPYTPPHILITSIAEVKVLSELGVIFLMFSLGLDFSFQKLSRVGFSASITGVIEVLMMVSIGYLAGVILQWPFHDRLFLGAALAISSTTIIIKALDELRLKSKRFAEYIFGILVIEDLLAIILLVALSTIVTTKNIFSIDMLSSILKLIFTVGSWFLVGYFVVPSFLQRISHFVNQETLTIVSIALCLLLVTIAAYFHYSTALGAFIMGSILAETPLINRIEHLIRPIRDIFAAVFFISVGMLIDPQVIITYFSSVVLITVIYIIGKITSTTLGAFLTGQSLSTSVRIGFGLAQIGEFSFIIASLGLALHVTSDKLYPIIVAVSAITIFTTPYLIKFSGFLSIKLESQLPDRIKLFLDSYSAWVYRTLSSTEEYVIYRNALIRVVLNGIVVAIIFTIAKHMIHPRIIPWLVGKSISNITTWAIAMMLASPFIWGMLFSLRSSIGKRKDIFFNTTPILVSWLATIIEITILSITYFHNLITTTLLIFITFIFLFISFKQLEKSYHWFERRLLRNIKSKLRVQTRYEQLAPWETHFVEIRVSEESTLINKTLLESQLRQAYGINIVAMYRGKKEILAPRGDQIIAPNDKLIVLGNDQQIDAFKEIATPKTSIDDNIEKLSALVLKALVLNKDSPKAYKTIRDSKIREKFKGIVVGIERDSVRTLNPDPAMTLLPGDLLLIVGEKDSLKRMLNEEEAH